METPCTPWAGRLDRDGYGRAGIRLAHRLAYREARGPIAEGLTLDHLCRNRACVNPDHLEPVTLKVNVARSPRAMARYCKQGHEFTPDNTYRWKGGKRICRTCNAAAVRGYKARKAVAE